MSLATVFLDRLRSGIERSSLISCSRYVEKTRIMGPPVPGPWGWKYHPWLRAMHDCNNPLIVGQKSAQMGYTETALNRVFFAIDRQGQDVLYVLPKKRPDASDFSSARFDPALELSPGLAKLFSATNNVDHKRAGAASLYVRGSMSRSGLKSVPVGLIVLDELDEMNQANIALAMARTDGQIENAAVDVTKQVFMISTPTIEGYGINLWFNRSSKDHFYFKCPSCDRLIELMFPRNIMITADDASDSKVNDSYIYCHRCQVVLRHQDKPNFLDTGRWVSQNDSDNKGFYINQLYSSGIKPGEIARRYLNSLSNPLDEQEFFNSNLGLPHTVEGARITPSMIEECIGDYSTILPAKAHKTHYVTMGVDVGKFLHIVICDWYWEGNPTLDPCTVAHCKVIAIYKMADFAGLDRLMIEYKPNSTVIDLNPERRLAREFCFRWPGHAYACEYSVGTSGRNIISSEEDLSVKVDRTSWLDMTLSRFHSPQSIRLPSDVSFEYREQLQALTRIYYRDTDANVKAKYVKGTGDDHFAHAQNYAEIAFGRAVIRAGNQTIGSPW